MPKLSVIVPVYNAEKSLSRCVDSFLAQTFTDFELILVNDGSSDSSAILCDAYAAENPKIKTIHKNENTGPLHTRRVGFEQAYGEYISYVDSDDYIHPSMYEIMMKPIVQYRPDIVICGIMMESEVKSIPLCSGAREGIYDKARLVKEILALLLCLCVKFIIRTDFDFPYVAGMVLILSCNYYFNYYFAMAHRILLRADQKIRVIQSVQIVTILVNLADSIIAIELSCGIHAVKLISTLIYLSNPLIFRLYVRKHYAIGKAVYDENRTIPRKSSAMIHHRAFFVHANTDIVLLSLFNGTKEVSVYSVYNSVVYTLENFFVAISDALSGSIGQLLATNQKDKLRYTFET